MRSLVCAMPVGIGIIVLLVSGAMMVHLAVESGRRSGVTSWVALVGSFSYFGVGIFLSGHMASCQTYGGP